MSALLLKSVFDEDTDHKDRWLVSYADLLTLMLAFFVVMYSIAQMKDGRAEILSRKLSEVFPNKQAELETVSASIIDLGGKAGQHSNGEQQSEQKTDNTLEKLGDTIQQQFSGVNELQVRGNEEWLQIELDSNLLFGSGAAELSTDALILLKQVANIFGENDLPIRVEGFTDDIPVNGGQFPSNWELSAARSAAVVRYLVSQDVAPNRMAVVGYGQYQPVVDNDSKENRAKNRRVLLTMAKVPELRPRIIPVERELFNGVTNSAGVFVKGITKSSQETKEAAQSIVKQMMAEQMSATAPRLVAPESLDNSVDAVEASEPVVPPEPTFNTIELNDGGLLFTNETEN